MPYNLGEDARKIDWKSTAKTGEPHIKLFFQEREANVVLCALMSGSLLFRDKKELQLRVCSHIGFSTLKLSNTLKPIIISDKIKLFPSTKKVSSNEHFLRELDKIELFKKQIDLKNIGNVLHQKLKKKSFIFLVGDFLGELDLSLLVKRHEIFVIIIRDKFEDNPEILNDGEFTDPESAESLEIFFGKKARDAYAAKYTQNDKILYKHLNSLGISYTKIKND